MERSMGSKPGAVTQGAVTKIIGGAKKAGASVVTIELPNGTKATVSFQKAAEPPTTDNTDEWKV
jgi:hypothetical protein